MTDTTGETLPLRSGVRGSELSISGLTVTVEAGPDAGKSAELTSTSLRIGTDPASDLALSDLTASRKHLMLTVTPDGILAEDLQSKNGTLLNGTRIRSAFVPDGGTLAIGSTTLRVRARTGKIVIVPEAATMFLGMMGQSQAMRDIFALVKQLAKTDLPVSITGETGTGKELIGRALHQAGPRKDRRFLVLDCGAIVQDLLRSELFGHERGSFTGAERTTRGILEEAAGGTVFLDEIGEIDVSIQPHLLRALETKEICRIGSRTPVPVDFRIVSATNRDLRKSCQEGKFRQDLFYRLSCVTIRLPALRERLEDLPLIARHFVEACAQRHGVAAPDLTDEALAVLSGHHWPGNVRELRNIMEAATVLAEGEPIRAAHIRLDGSAEPAEPAPPRLKPQVPGLKPPTLDDIEKQAIIDALEATSWNRRAAARRLGVSPTTIFERIRRWGLRPPAGADSSDE